MAKDPYRYFRIEAQELIEALGKGLLTLEKAPDEELVRQLLRQAHTLKGASRVVKRSDIGDLAHQIEDFLLPHRNSSGPVEREMIDRALEKLDRIRQSVTSLGEEPGRAEAGESTATAPAAEPDGQTIRIAVEDLDVLIESAFEAHAAASALLKVRERIVRLRGRVLGLIQGEHGNEPSISAMRSREEIQQIDDAFEKVQSGILEGVDQVLAELAEVRTNASELRLVPAQMLAIDLDRAVRDAAQTLGKEVETRWSGTQTHIDAHVLAGLRKALVHLVRNSVAHGIEDRGGRTKAGKPAVGSIEISIERRGSRVAILCRDDGRGLDLGSVRTAIAERGLVAPESARVMGEGDLSRILFSGGVSTSRIVTGVSGRGVGLDAVRETIEALKGEISLRSVQGKGTTVEILVPISLSAVPALALQVDQRTLLVPLDSVRQTMRISRKEISRDAEGERLVVNGRVTPFFPLRNALNQEAREGPEMQSAVLLEAEGRMAAIGIDRIGAARNVVVHNLPEHARPDPIITGAAFDDAGNPQLVLGASAVVRKAWEPHPVRATVAIEPRAPVLVIDDSLTTRMLEQSILESAGYEVDLAVSGEEGLRKARARRYGLFIVDVEMPGMDGFQFIEATRKDPGLREIPSIMVTSRGDAQDKRRGKEAGARAYIVKSEFDQAELLESIRRLMG